MFAAAGCASRPQPLNPYVPPETMYSAGGTLAAVGGVMASSVGASMMDPDRSPQTRKIGAAATGAGLALMGAAVLEAIEVEMARQKFVSLHNAFVRSYFGSPTPDSPLRTPPPPLPDVPFQFGEGDSPLSGRDSKP
jgi:hypothetical protein